VTLYSRRSPWPAGGLVSRVGGGEEPSPSERIGKMKSTTEVATWYRGRAWERGRIPRKVYVKCKECKQRSIPAPGTLSKDGKTCLCGDCERAVRYSEAKPDNSHFGITEGPALTTPSELDGVRNFDFQEDTPKEWTRAYKRWARAQGKNWEDVRGLAQREIGQTLSKLNQYEANARRKMDEVVRRHLGGQFPSSHARTLAVAHPSGLPRFDAGDRSAATRRTWKVIYDIDQERHKEFVHAERKRALRDVLRSPEFAGVCTRSEIDLIRIWVSAPPLWQEAGISIYDWIANEHQLFCDGNLGCREVKALLDDENPRSIPSRILRRWLALRGPKRKDKAPPELAEAVSVLIDQDEPELTDVSEVNARVFSATGNDDGDVFPRAVYARPRFCWQQSITARNVETAYGDDSPSAVYQRSRIELFRHPDPDKLPVAPRYGSGLAKVAVPYFQKITFKLDLNPVSREHMRAGVQNELFPPRPLAFLAQHFNNHRTPQTGPSRALVLQDRLRAPETLTLSYSQFGRGYNQGLAEPMEINKATRAMREQALKGKKYVRMDDYKSLRPRDERAPWRKEDDDLSENSG